MKFIPENFEVEVLNKIFRDTKSGPQDLLNWLEGVLRDFPREPYPCNRRLYLDKYSFDILSSKVLIEEDSNRIFVEDFYDNGLFMASVYRFYEYLLKSLEFRESFFEWYRDYFKLGDEK